MYGPFHRKSSPTQTLETARSQRESGEIWGKVGRLNGFFPTVRAYKKPLCFDEPPGADCVDCDGIEFITVACPNLGPGGMAFWCIKDRPVEGLRHRDDETISLKATIYKIIYKDYVKVYARS